MPDTPDTPGPAAPAPLPGGVPASARDRAVELLTRGFADDRLSEAELEAMLDRVYAARTMAELEQVTSVVAPEGAAAAEGAAGASVAVRPDTFGAVVGRRRISATFSAQSLRLTGAVPQDLQVRARLGNVELDLTGATFQPGVTEIHVRALMGYVEIRLPSHVRVESDGHALFGYFALSGAGATRSDAVVRIRGRATFGYAECFVAKEKPEPPPA